MSLEDRLWEALEPAARRAAQRPRFTLPHVQPRALRTAAAVLIALAALAASGALIAVLARPASHTAAPAPSKVKTGRVGTGLSDAATGFGSVWMYDAGDQRLLRVDPATRRVLEWVSVPSPFVDVAIATGAGAVWAVPVQNTGHMTAAIPRRALPLVRIDPQNGRTVARVPIRVPGGRPILPIGIEATTDAVWVWGQTAAVRIDPHSNRVTQAIRMPNDTIKGLAIDRGDIWIATEGQRLLRFDARTGARTARFPGRPLMQPTQLVVLPRVIVLDGESGTLYARDRETGRTVWQARMPSRLRSAVTVGNRIWILTASATRPVDELVALDPDTGRAVARIGLPTSGGVALQAVGSDLWVTDHNGDVHIVHP
jgi:outer membrane protein assembly factor BamB